MVLHGGGVCTVPSLVVCCTVTFNPNTAYFLSYLTKKALIQGVRSYFVCILDKQIEMCYNFLCRLAKFAKILQKSTKIKGGLI